MSKSTRTKMTLTVRSINTLKSMLSGFKKQYPDAIPPPEITPDPVLLNQRFNAHWSKLQKY